MDRPKERQLITQILQGDEKALKTFWRLNSSKILAFIKKKIANPADAEELLQDTFLACLEKLRDFEGRSSLSTFLCAIARHKVIDYYRRKKVKQIVFSQLPEEVIPILTAFFGPEEVFDAHEVRARIQTALRLLKPHYRKVLTLKYIEGRSVGEIARELTVSLKSAESTLFRARMAFVKQYQEI